MSTVIRSNVRASKYIASRMQLSLPTDYKHKLDFVAEEYLFNNVKSTLAQCVSTTRASTAGYLDSNGNYATAPINTPRIHNDPHVGKGLLCEQAHINHFTEYSNPPNQTIAINAVTTQFLIVQMFGEGSCEIQINNVVIGTITKNNPIAYRPAVNGAINLTMTKTGEVNHIQAFFDFTPKPCMTKLTPTTSIKDIHYFHPKFASNKVGTVVYKRTELKDFSDTLIGGRLFTNFQLLPATAGYLTIASSKGVLNPSKSLWSLTGQGGSENEFRFGKSVNSEVVALTYNFNDNTMKIYENGAITKQPLPAFSDRNGFDRWILGSNAAGTIALSAQLIKEVYAYNRVLSDTELLAIG